MSVYFWLGDVLFDDDVAMHEDCCCGFSEDCDICQTDTTPQFIDVTLHDIEDQTCTCDPAFNGKFRCEYLGQSGSPVDRCTWVYYFDKVCETSYDEAISLSVEKRGATYYLVVILGFPTDGGYLAWEEAIGTSLPDCSDFDQTVDFDEDAASRCSASSDPTALVESV